MNSDELNKEQRLAMIGVALAYSEPQGEAPTLFEIDQWRSGLVSGDRGDEILSYIANDHMYFKHWQDLCESQEWLDADAEAQKQGSSSVADVARDTATTAPGQMPVQQTGEVGGFRKWMAAANSPRFLGAVAAGVFGLLILPQFIMAPSSPYGPVDDLYDQYRGLGVSQPAAPWVPGTTKTLSAGPVDLQTFRSGVADAIDRLALPADKRWAQWIDSLSSAGDNPCGAPDNELCTPAAEQLQALGQWSVLTHVACAADGSGSRDALLREQDEVWSLVASQVKPQGPGSAADILALGDSFPDVCDRAEAGLSIAVLRAE